MTTEIMTLYDNRQFRIEHEYPNMLSPDQRRPILNQLGISYNQIASIRIEQLQNTITVTNPTAGASWNAGTSYNVTWTSAGSAVGGDVLIELLKGGLINGQISCSTLNNGTFAWAPASNNLGGTDYQIRITKIGTTYSGISPNFTLVSTGLGKMNVIYPSCGETLHVGSNYNIKWEGFGDAAGGNVDITLEKAGIFNLTIATGTTNDGTLSWTVPLTQTLGNDYRIRVTKPGTPSYSDNSNVPLTIDTAVSIPCQTVTVLQSPADIVATNMIIDKSSCTSPCNIVVTVTWKNNGASVGTLIPNITINGTPGTAGPTQSLNPGVSYTLGFNVSGLTTNVYTICPLPN